MPHWYMAGRRAGSGSVPAHAGRRSRVRQDRRAGCLPADLCAKPLRTLREYFRSHCFDMCVSVYTDWGFKIKGPTWNENDWMRSLRILEALENFWRSFVVLQMHRWGRLPRKERCLLEERGSCGITSRRRGWAGVWAAVAHSLTFSGPDVIEKGGLV